MKKIHLFELNSTKNDFVEDIINEWLELNQKAGEYKLIKIDHLDHLNGVDILLFNAHINDARIDQIKGIINRLPNINICFFVSPKDISTISQLNELNCQYRNANIGTILKPVPFSKANEFMNSVVSRIKPLEFEDNSDDFDISEFLHNY